MSRHLGTNVARRINPGNVADPAASVRSGNVRGTFGASVAVMGRAPTAALVVNRKRIRNVPHLHRRSVATAAARGWQVELLEARAADAGRRVTRGAGGA